MITKCGASIFGLRLSEDADAVGDGLGPGHGRPAVGEGPGEIEERHAQQQPGPLVAERHLTLGDRDMAEGAAGGLRQPGEDQQRHIADEEVGGDSEDPSGFFQAAQVAVGDQDHKSHGQGDRHRAERGDRRDDGVGAGRHRDSHCDGVADQQGGAGNLGDVRPEVVPAHHVRAAGLRVGLDDIPVADRHHGQYGQDEQGCRRDQGEGRQPADGNQDPQDLLGGVRRGRHHIRGQDGERGRLAQALTGQVIVDQRWSEQQLLEPVGA